jgi:hypothetical protein
MKEIVAKVNCDRKGALKQKKLPKDYSKLVVDGA